MNHPLDGVFELLKRADENIINLNLEITVFLSKSANSSGMDDDDQTFLDFARSHIYREVPIRFSVLAGEIIHGLRTALNHLAFQLTPDHLRVTNEILIEFPIYAEDPARIGAKKDELTRYRRKIQGISPSATAIIDNLQPYRMVEPFDHPLMIVHDMDRTIKHRELALVKPIFRVGVVSENQAQLEFTNRNVAMDVKFSTEVAFRKFGKRENEPVIPGLQQLSNAVRKAIMLFRGEFK